MSRSCPISLRQIDSNIARINAAVITALVIAFLFTSFDFILYFLMIDFLLRLLEKNFFSLVYNFSKFIKKSFSIKNKPTDAAPKRLAAFFGLTFTLFMIVFEYLNLTVALEITAFILLTCSSLEAFFNYCLGCEIYHLYKKTEQAFLKKPIKGN